MVKIKINGEELEGRYFQNMPQALAFAFQNGNCHTAKTLELISSTESEQKTMAKPEKPSGDKTGGKKNLDAGPSTPQADSTPQAA